MNLDAYMDDFGREIKRAAAGRRSRRRALRLLLPAVPALAIAIAVLPGGGGGVDAIAAARAALAPDGEIIHMKLELREGRRVFLPIEQWYAADPPRWRTRNGERAPVETAFSEEGLRVYDAESDQVTVYRDPRAPRGPAPGLLATDLRAQLDRGGVRDEGTVTVDGREVRKLVQQGVGQRLVYYADPGTFAPVGGQVIPLHRGEPARAFAFTVTAYERIPLDERSERLLDFDKTPHTKYVWR